MNKAPQHLQDLVSGVVVPLGYELVGVELLSRNKAGHLLRIYIDAEKGIGVDDCTKVSHQLSGVLDVEDPISGEYALEVSSPGLDRPLFELPHFEQFVGRLVRVKLNMAVAGRRNYKGTITSVAGSAISLLVENETVQVNFEQIDSARLVPEF